MTVNYRCPVCGEKLKLSENSYRCRNRHCFDLSAKGYVNLLLRLPKRVLCSLVL